MQYSVYPTKISVDGDDVYVADLRLDSNKDAIGTYWKNGVRHEVKSPQGALPYTINGIFANNNNVYVAGNTNRINDKSFAFHWENSIPVELETPDNTIPNAEDMTVIGNDVYVVGSASYTFSSGMNYTHIACYWKNEIRHEVNGTDVELGQTSTAYSIFVKGNDVYICGYVYDPSTFPAYWKNRERVRLSDSGGVAQSIFVDEQDNVYVVGYIEPSRGVYWKNEELFELPGSYSFLNSVQVINDDVFIGGTIKIDDQYSFGYWKNNEFHSQFISNEFYEIKEMIFREIPRSKK